MPEVKSPEDAVRYYDAADMYGFAYERDPQPADDGWLSFISTIVCLLVVAVFLFSLGALVAFAWSVPDDIPARGVQDSIR